MASTCRMALKRGFSSMARPAMSSRTSLLAGASVASASLRSSLQLLNKQPSLRATYASAAGLSRGDIQSRIFEILKGFEAVDASKISESAAFTTDLGLDSLDTVEVVMAVEEEFGIEIPDTEADQIQTVKQAIDYIEKTPDAS